VLGGVVGGALLALTISGALHLRQPGQAIRALLSAAGNGLVADPELVELSRRAATEAGVDDLTQFRVEDLFTTDLRSATVVTLYLYEELNRALLPRLLEQLRPGARVVSHAFLMGGWRPDRSWWVPAESGYNQVYLWWVPASVGGEWEGEGALAGVRLRVEQQYQELEVAVEGVTGASEGSLLGERITFRVPAGTISAAPAGGDFRGVVHGDRLRGAIHTDGAELEARAVRLSRATPGPHPALRSP
jgi:hypothetical protein